MVAPTRLPPRCESVPMDPSGAARCVRMPQGLPQLHLHVWLRRVQRRPREGGCGAHLTGASWRRAGCQCKPERGRCLQNDLGMMENQDISMCIHVNECRSTRSRGYSRRDCYKYRRRCSAVGAASGASRLQQWLPVPTLDRILK